ncbi:hypothetical protein [Ruegeria sp.]|uniref:hypothetical protein n=1 Tax=Ruegeria sp. TaxID=1879320 RepID=UPI003B5B085B
MESEGHVLDEAKVDSAIADLLRDDEPEEPEPAAEPVKTHDAFPDLPDQAEMDEETAAQDTGLSATLRQKWAELRGAA